MGNVMDAMQPMQPHMWHTGWWFFGMHVFWWAFWVVLIVVLFASTRPARKNRATSREDALEILRRGYAAGKFSTEEYEQRKAVIERDAAAAHKSASPP